MLKALELVGFKSFADKTRFDFPAGITVVVGPNGSGKSNIVDGIKWVLGEQSAKSLRGKEMADVIFKGAGSTTGGRKAANTAEATLILENENRHIDYDADEIHVTRRVYRSGEGEYLINGEACRLKDIRDLFRGTGVGTDAYSLIEQGKVDRLLQASAKERRAIFEEAAGISRFKAKKIEAQRRLARVEQNLLRLSDIVEEVGSRYRSVKAQASKASRYREYSERLKFLRTQTGLIEFRRINEQLIAIEEEQSQIATETEKANALIDVADREVSEFESTLASSTADTSTSEQRISAFRSRIAALESTAHHERTRYRELEQQKSNLQNQLVENRTRLADLGTRLTNARAEQESAELAYAEAVESAAGLESQIAAALEQLTALQLEYDEANTRRVEKDRLLQSLNGLIQTDEGELKNVNTFLVQQQAQIAEYQSDIAQVKQQLELLRQEEQRIAEEAESKDSALAQARSNLEETRRAYEQCNREIAKLKSEHSGIAQRAEVIQELEQRLDGVHAGVKQVLALSGESSQTPFGEVHGLVADLVQVHVQHAPLVDVILGDLSQHVVVAGDALLPAIAHPETPLKGRVGFIRLDHLPAPSSALKVDLAGQPGVVGRADQLVRFADHYRPLMEKLLGDTWVVKTMDDALRLQEETTHLIRYTTLDGDLFEKDGTIVVGPRSSSLGLVSRRSELRSLKIQVKELEQQLLQRQATADDLSTRLTGYEQESERLMGEHTHLARALSDQRVTTKAASERHDHLTKSLLALQKEHDGTTQKQAALDASLVEHQSALKLAAAAIEQLAGLLNQRKQSISQLQKASEADSARLNQLKVEIAKGEQQLAGLEESTRALTVALEERQATGRQLTADLQACVERYVAAQRSILDATSQLADIYIQKDQAVLQHSQILESRETLTADLRKAREVFRTQQQHIKKLESRQHDIELSATQIVHSCTTMTERLRDDYGIEIAKLDIEIDPEIESAKETVEDEISQLRRKINNIGAVNTDALVELEDLESRYLTLDGQYQDLVQAKETLDKIIVRINADSRRLFAETLEAIRQNFQVLYRRTFGGGRADIILEEGVDILDAGIEIVATPPGKPEFNNSLLSGGEKALTAVSLLMAIFQFRPSPFCVLDEVDAPFDEANIGRFVDVLRSFLGWTKFVIVTHSKKTMTAANTLHGVTMEESGVSTRVSVRFDDVTEDGQILSTTNRANTDDDKGAA